MNMWNEQNGYDEHALYDYLTAAVTEIVCGEDAEREARKLALVDYAMSFPLVPPGPMTLTPETLYATGWAPPPHPIEIIPSVNPGASHADQARAVLYDYYHDDETRGFTDDGNVQAAFGVNKSDQDFDPVALIYAYEHKSDPVWKKPGMVWQHLADAVDHAIARRLKLGPLPASSYDADPVVIYYYDHDNMKKVTYPRLDIPDALHPGDTSWWKHGGIGTYQSNDPKQIAAERKKPGFPGGGNWGGEGFDWNKDVVGNIQAIVSIIMEVVGAVLQVIPGVGTAVGTAVIIGGAVVASIAGAIDDAFAGKDNAGALAGIAKGLLQAAAAGISAETNVKIPPEAMKALSGTVDLVAQEVSAGQKSRLSYSELWNKIAKKADSYGKLGDDEAHAISVILGENAAGKLFIEGHTVGKYATPKQIEAISKIVEGFSVFVKDPKALQIFLLGAGIGHLSSAQAGRVKPSASSQHKAGSRSTAPSPKKKHKHAAHAPAAHAAHGGWTSVGVDAKKAKDDLDAFVAWRLKPRYGLNKKQQHAAHAARGSFDGRSDMDIWCGQDGSFNDEAGDGPADLDGLEEDVVVGWQDPFTDWDGNLFDGMGQYGVYTVSDPWEPAEFAAIPYPAEEDPYASAPPAPPASTQQPPSPLETPAAPAAPGPPHFGPPPPGGHGPHQRPGGGTRSNAHSTMARGEGVVSYGRLMPASPSATMTGFDVPAAGAEPVQQYFVDPCPPSKYDAQGHHKCFQFCDPQHPERSWDPKHTATGFDMPFTDDDGNLLMDPHPAHQDWPYPMTYGDPVMTGWDTPLTDLEGQLLSGEGQYGQFTMENPYDHRSFNNVNLEAPGLEGDPFYYYTGADDAGQSFGSAIGSMFGSAAGEDSKSWGQAGSSIASSIEQGSDSGDWGSALGSIAAATAKVAIPAIVKAASSSSSSSSTPTTTPSATTPATTAATTATPNAINKDPHRLALRKLLVQTRKLAQQYGIALPTRAPRTHVAPAQSNTALQTMMQQLQGQGTQ